MLLNSAKVFLLYLYLLDFVTSKVVVNKYDDKECFINNNLKEEIKSYQETVVKIFDYVVRGEFKGRSYNEYVCL